MAKKKKAAPRTGDLLSSMMAARPAEMDVAGTPTPTQTPASVPSRTTPAANTSLTATELAMFGVPAAMAAAPARTATTAAVTAATTAATTAAVTTPVTVIPGPGTTEAVLPLMRL